MSSSHSTQSKRKKSSRRRLHSDWERIDIDQETPAIEIEYHQRIKSDTNSALCGIPPSLCTEPSTPLINGMGNGMGGATTTTLEHPSFEWDSNRSHRDLVLSEHNKRFTKHSTKWCRSLCSKNMLSADTVSTVRWELTLKQKGIKRTALMMGFVDERNVDDFKSWKAFGFKCNEVALEVNDGHYPMMFTLGTATHCHEKWKFETNLGDRFRIDFDFTEMKCTAFYNDECLGVLSSDLPQRIHLAASVLYGNSSFETTLFELL